MRNLISKLVTNRLADVKVSVFLDRSLSTKQQILAVVVITKKNCLSVFAASMRVISAMTGNLPLAGSARAI